MNDKSKYSILMADDEEDVLSVMAKKISQDGFDVITATNGEEAWQKIIKNEPDLIILDLNMPVRDGFDILRELRESPPYEKWSPVIIVSARTELDDLKQGFDLQADHYITKPCTIEDIRKAIRLIMSLLPQRDDIEPYS